MGAVTYPAATIAVGEKLSSDIQYTSFSWLGANTEWTWTTNTVLWDCSPVGGNCYYQAEGASIPDGAIASTVAYPNGQNGGISSKHFSQSNFVFADGHAKAMRPSQTNPDGYNQPQNNMWVSSRQ